eukprot:12123985-Alexandrium_andersonii.AAC.1
MRLVGTLPGLGALLHLGMPQFSKDDQYLGPLPRNCGSSRNRLIGQDDVGFKTRGCVAYPPCLRQDLARCIFRCGPAAFRTPLAA